jgi:hypothetical protein
MAPTVWLQRIVVRIVMLVAIAFGLIGLAVVGQGLYSVSRTGDWQHLWDALLGFGRYVWILALLPYWGGWLALPEMRGALPALERAAITGDGRQAPLAAGQPEVGASPAGTDEAVTLGRLRMAREDLARSYAVARWGLYGLTLVVAVLAVELIVTAVLLGFATAQSGGMWAIQVGIVVALIVLLAPLIAIGVYLVRKARSSHAIAQRLRAGLRIQADAEGVRWEDAGSGEERRLLWPEARAFYVITAPEGQTWASFTQRFRRHAADPRPAVSVYALASERTRLMWAAPTAREPEALAEHQRLCELIAAHTRLLLRDLSTATGSLAQAMRYAMNGRRPSPAMQTALRELGLPMTDLPLERVQRKTQRLSWLSLALLAPYLVVALVGIAGSILQHLGIG